MRSRPLEVTEFDGVTVFCRGTKDGLPVFGYGQAPGGLLTRLQLREIDLTPGVADPVALLEFHTRYGWQTANLYRVEQARPRRADTPGLAAARALAMAARRTCRTCTRVVDHCVRGPRRQCSDCYDVAEENAA